MSDKGKSEFRVPWRKKRRSSFVRSGGGGGGGGPVAGEKVFFIGDSENEIDQYKASTPYDVSTITHSKSFNVNNQDTVPGGVVWGDGGSKVYMAGSGNDNVYQYSATNNHDIGSLSFDKSFDVSNEDTDLEGLAFDDAGDNLYVAGNTSDSIHEYGLTTQWDIGTASHSNEFDVSGKDGSPLGMFWGSSGGYMYFSGGDTDSVYQYKSSVDYDTTTLNYQRSLSVDSETVSLSHDVSFNKDGDKMYVLDGDGIIHEYDLSTKWDISTATFNQNTDISTNVPNARGLHWLA